MGAGKMCRRKTKSHPSAFYPLQIIYMDAFRVVNSSVEYRDKHLLYCIRWLLDHRVYSQASQVYIAENLPGNTGGMVAHVFRDVPYSITMAEVNKNNKRLGVGKTHQSTLDMTVKMKNMLCENRLAFARDMGTYMERGVGGALSDDSRQPDEMKQLLISQLSAFRWDTEKRKYTGKGMGMRDDSAIAAMMAPQWAPVFHSSPAYATFRAAAFSRRVHFNS